MKKMLMSAVALAALAGPAFAADLPVKAPVLKAPPLEFNWTGFYIGANGGWGHSRKCWTALPGGVPAVPGIIFTTGDEGCHNPDGGVAGGQIGYRWQSSSWVFGLEAQGDWADLTGSRLSAAFGTPAFGNAVDRTKIDAFGLFTGQLGWAWNTMLLYVKGGAAVVGDKFTYTAGPPATQVGTASDTRWGGTVGAGIEYSFGGNWSIGAEYDHLFMGRRNETLRYTTGVGFVGVAPGTFIGTQPERIKQDVDLFTVRLNYRFGGPVIARY